MKRNQLVGRLIKEGFSEKTLVNFSDKQLYELSERVLGEAVMKQVKVLSMANPKDAEEVNALVNDPNAVKNQIAQGHVQVTKEEKKLSKNQSDKMDTDKDGDIDSADLKNLRNKKKKVEVKEEKPSAGLSKEKKSEVVKKAIKGGDIGKKGKGFKEIEKSAKESGAKDPKAVAGAAMWKNIKRESVEVKNWVKNLAESNFHSFTSKSEIMELVQDKLSQHEVGPNVKKGHNNVPEFMSYDAISKSEVKEDNHLPRQFDKKYKDWDDDKKESSEKEKNLPRQFDKKYKDWDDDKKSKSEVKEDGTTTKPKTKPTTKPSKPKPKTPYNPGPGKNPKPKALKEDK